MSEKLKSDDSAPVSVNVQFKSKASIDRCEIEVLKTKMQVFSQSNQAPFD